MLWTLLSECICPSIWIVHAVAATKAIGVKASAATVAVITVAIAAVGAIAVLYLTIIAL
jgi:hypothetical protein